MKHVKIRNQERDIFISQKEISKIAKNCPVDTAILLGRNEQNSFRNWKENYDESNGDLVVLIVRNKVPITVMYRRSDQPFTSRALRVNCVKIIY